MKRDYEEGIVEKVCYFVGHEVEKTPAYKMKTLFIEGVQDTEEIMTFFKKEKCQHLFFGANHSFNPGTNFPGDADEWSEMGRYDHRIP